MAWHLLLLSWVALLGVAMGASPSPPSGTPSAVESAKSILQPQEILAGSSAMTGGEAAGRAVLAVHPSKVDPARESVGLAQATRGGVSRPTKNITLVHEHLGDRWDDSVGKKVDMVLTKGDDQSFLQTAMMVLACVAVLIICGGPCVVWLCWRNREKTGLLRGSSKSYAEQESVDDMRGKFMRIPI